MFKFEHEQKIFDIAGVKVGGQPGERPTVLIGSIFYQGHKVVENEKEGIFDERRAEELINRQDEFSDKTGNPCMIDVVGSTPKALRRYLEFVATVTDAPILMDGGTTVNNLAGLEYVKEVGLVRRVVYNSLTPEARQEELDKIKETRLKCAVLLALDVKDPTVRGRLAAAKGLLKVAKAAGITKLMIDTAVLDVPSLGQACQAIFALKSELGLPVGCGAHNAVSTWKGLVTKMGEQAVKPSLATANAIPVVIGADFILYGPIEDAEVVFPSVAMIDAACAQLAIERGKLPKGDHPIFKIA